jgi:hypothetical protein
MRLEFNARPNARPLEQLVDGFIFLSGGILQFLDGLDELAHETGFGGKVRIEVVARELLDGAVEPLAAKYDEADLERAAEVLRAAIDRIGRRFYAHQYEGDDSPLD